MLLVPHLLESAWDEASSPQQKTSLRNAHTLLLFTTVLHVCIQHRKRGSDNCRVSSRSLELALRNNEKSFPSGQVLSNLHATRSIYVSCGASILSPEPWSLRRPQQQQQERFSTTFPLHVTYTASYSCPDGPSSNLEETGRASCWKGGAGGNGWVLLRL